MTGRGEVAVLLLLVVANVAGNTVVPEPVQLVTGPAVAAATVFIALRSGLTLAQLGLTRDRVGAGLRWGGVAAAAIAGVLVVALAVPATRDLLADDVLADSSTGSLLYEAFVRIPVATVGPEEVLFRGVVLAMAIRQVGVAWGVTISSVLFGLWHVLPTIDDYALISDAGSVVPTGGALGVTLGTVAVTSMAGAVFAWLRLRSGSVAAPFLAHWALNGLALLAAAAAA